MRILVTRPPPGGLRTAGRLRAMGHAVVEAPALHVGPTGAAWPAGGFDAIVLTSANGLEGLGAAAAAALQPVPVFAVGRRTAEAAREGGFRHVHAADGDAASLAARLAATLPGGARLLYPTGVVRKPDLERALADAGFPVVPVETYDARPVAPAVLAQALAGPVPDAVLHYSRATAEAWLAAARAGGHEAALLAGPHLVLSPDVGEPLRRAGASRLLVADRPDEEALFALLDRLA